MSMLRCTSTGICQQTAQLGTGVIWSGAIPAKVEIHAATMALPLWASASSLELRGSNESYLPLDSRFRGNDCLQRAARKINFPQMTSVPAVAIDSATFR